MTAFYVAALFIPALLLALAMRRVHRAQAGRKEDSGGWFRSPARRAEVAERHPFLVLSLVMLVVCSPLPLHAILTGGSYVLEFGLWLVLAALGAGLTLYLGNRQDNTP